ncbi:MAG: YbaK/EbsC family protein [Conexivisphaerales archaeon]|nr:YbaK/EbsC family protein [Conexivisphaerales archaeon]
MNETDLKRYLEEEGISFKIIKHGSSYRADEASRELNTDIKSIVKTVLFIADRKDPVIIIVRGDKRVDQTKMAKLLGYKKLRLATPEELREITGYEPGTLPPVAHKQSIKTVLDEDVMHMDYVYAGGGSLGSSLKISPKDIARLQNALILKV